MNFMAAQDAGLLTPAPAKAEAGESAAMGWDDLTKDEQTALKRMNRGPYPALAPALAERLMQLGLAVERPGGIGISRAGRELVISTLLRARDQQA